MIFFLILNLFYFLSHPCTFSDTKHNIQQHHDLRPNNIIFSTSLSLRNPNLFPIIKLPRLSLSHKQKSKSLFPITMAECEVSAVSAQAKPLTWRTPPWETRGGKVGLVHSDKSPE